MSETNLLQPANRRWQILSGNFIKYLAAALMLCDHLHEFIFRDVVWLNMLGRLVLPIFLFMVAEGFYYTRNRIKYLLRMLVAFWVMNLGNWVIERAFPLDNIPIESRPMLVNNVFGLMFMVALYLLLIEFFKDGVREKKIGKIVGGVLLLLAPIAFAGLVMFLLYNVPGGAMIYLFVPNLLTMETGFLAALLGISFYLLRRWRWAQMLPLLVYGAMQYYAGLKHPEASNIQWMMVFAAIPLLLYSGRRSWSSERPSRGMAAFHKWFFYVFYAVHIWALYLVAWWLQR